MLNVLYVNSRNVKTFEILWPVSKYLRCLVCGLLLCIVNMNRSNPFKNIQKTFSSLPVSRTVRLKTPNTLQKYKVNNLNKTKTPVKKFSQSSTEFKIDDSDEENSPKHTVVRSTPKRAKKSKLVLNVNTSANSSLLNQSVWSSDSGESVNIDSDENTNTTLNNSSFRVHDRKRVRKKRLSFLTEVTPYKSISRTKCDSSKNSSNIKQNIASLKNTFYGNISRLSRNGRPDENISDPESLDGNDNETKDYESTKKKRRTSQISCSASTESSIQVIEQSSQTSVKLLTQSLQERIKSSPRPRKPIKGGLVESLKRVENQSKSEFAHWMNECLSHLIERGEKMIITQIDTSYGRVLVHCKRANGCTSILCVDPMHKRISTLQVGKQIEVGIESTGYMIDKNVYFYPFVKRIM